MTQMSEDTGALLPSWSGSIESKFTPEANVVIASGDSLDILRSAPREFAKLVITSPPYNLGKAYEKATDLETYLKALDPIVDQLVMACSPKTQPN